MDKIIQAGNQVMESHKRIYTFSIDKNGYNGEFTIKYQSLIDRMKIGTLRAKYLGDVQNKVDIYTDNIAYMCATLETLLISKPKWFNLEILDDYSVLEAVYEEYMNWSNSFRRDVEPSDNEEDSGTATNEEAMANHEDVQSAD